MMEYAKGAAIVVTVFGLIVLAVWLLTRVTCRDTVLGEHERGVCGHPDQELRREHDTWVCRCEVQP